MRTRVGYLLIDLWQFSTEEYFLISRLSIYSILWILNFPVFLTTLVRELTVA